MMWEIFEFEFMKNIIFVHKTQKYDANKLWKANYHDLHKDEMIIVLPNTTIVTGMGTGTKYFYLQN